MITNIACRKDNENKDTKYVTQFESTNHSKKLCESEKTIGTIFFRVNKEGRFKTAVDGNRIFITDKFNKNKESSLDAL